MCARVGGANTTPYILILAAHFAKRNTKFGGGGKIGIGKRGRAKIPSPQPPSFLPARVFSLARGARHQFRSKKVRILTKRHRQLGNEVIGSPATRARQPIFGEISSRFEFSKARSELFLNKIRKLVIIILQVIL